MSKATSDFFSMTLRCDIDEEKLGSTIFQLYAQIKIKSHIINVCRLRHSKQICDMLLQTSSHDFNKIFITFPLSLHFTYSATSMFESMWDSMSSSMQLAQECLEKNEDAEFETASSSSMEGLEKFAQTIDNSKNFTSILDWKLELINYLLFLFIRQY
jgi:hypothetical protein